MSRSIWLGGVALCVAMFAQAQVTNLEHFEAPAYPPLARNIMLSGLVALELEIAVDGSVNKVTGRQSEHPLLLQHAKDTVVR